MSLETKCISSHAVGAYKHQFVGPLTDDLEGYHAIRSDDESIEYCFYLAVRDKSSATALTMGGHYMYKSHDETLVFIIARLAVRAVKLFFLPFTLFLSFQDNDDSLQENLLSQTMGSDELLFCAGEECNNFSRVESETSEMKDFDRKRLKLLAEFAKRFVTKQQPTTDFPNAMDLKKKFYEDPNSGLGISQLAIENSDSPSHVAAKPAGENVDRVQSASEAHLQERVTSAVARQITVQGIRDQKELAKEEELKSIEETRRGKAGNRKEKTKPAKPALGIDQDLTAHTTEELKEFLRKANVKVSGKCENPIIIAYHLVLVQTL